MKKQYNSHCDTLSHSRPLEPSYILKDNKVLILANLDDKQYYELLKILVQADSSGIKQ